MAAAAVAAAAAAVALWWRAVRASSFQYESSERGLCSPAAAAAAAAATPCTVFTPSPGHSPAASRSPTTTGRQSAVPRSTMSLFSEAPRRSALSASAWRQAGARACMLSSRVIDSSSPKAAESAAARGLYRFCCGRCHGGGGGGGGAKILLFMASTTAKIAHIGRTRTAPLNCFRVITLISHRLRDWKGPHVIQYCIMPPDAKRWRKYTSLKDSVLSLSSLLLKFDMPLLNAGCLPALLPAGQSTVVCTFAKF